MNQKELETLRKKLQEEAKTLEEELAATGRKNPDHPGDWEPVSSELNVLSSDENELADQLESYQENQAVMNEFEKRYNEVQAALKRIDTPAYGICKICSKKIEKDRLLANPAATTCIEHKDK